MSMDLFDDRDEDYHVPSFDEWYANYPKKQGKAEARKRWTRMSGPEKVSAWDALVGWNRYASEHPQGNAFVPMASTWLNQSRWEDDPPQVAQPDNAHTRSMQVLKRAATEPADIFAIGGTE